MHPFRAFISLYTPISDADWETIKPFIKHKIMQAGRILLREGDICKKIYFLENGNISYFKKEAGSTVIVEQFHPPCLFSSLQSFAKQIPSEMGLIAEEESYIWTISRENAYKLLDNPVWVDFFSKL